MQSKSTGSQKAAWFRSRGVSQRPAKSLYAFFIARFVVHCDTHACLPLSGTFDMTLVVVMVVWLLVNAGLTVVTKASLLENQKIWILQVRILHDT